MDQSRHKRLIEAPVRLVLVAASYLSLLAMVGLFLAGLLQVGRSVLYVFGVLASAGEYPDPVVAAVKTAIKGLELFFLAPLPYLVLTTFRRQFEDTSTDVFDARARDDLVVAKSFSLTLIFALVASALAEQALSGTGLEYEAALSGSAFLLVLGLFILGLKRSVHH